MFFGTSVAGIPGTLVGLCVSIGTVWDAVTDPIVGYISDHSNRTSNNRQKFILISGLVMALSNIILWSVPLNLPNWQKFLWILISLLVFETADTFFATPYAALGYELATTKKDDTSIQAVKSVFYLLGMTAPSLLMMIFMKDNTAKLSYIKIALCTSFLIIISTLICVIILNKNKRKKIIINYPKNKHKSSFFHAFLVFFEFFKNKNYLFIIIGYSISTLATALLSSLGIHVFTYSFHFTSNQISILLLLLVLGAMLSQPILSRSANKCGITKTLLKYILITLVGVGLIAGLFAVRALSPTSVNFILCALFIFICGFGSGALYSLPFAMFSGIIKQENSKSKSNQTATLSGVMTFVFKMSNALSLFIVGALLDIIKFDSSQPVQPLKVQNALGVIMIFGVSISLALSIHFFSKYKSN